MECARSGFENQRSTLDRKMRVYSLFAWVAVVVGALAAAYGLWRVRSGTPNDLALLGSYLQGAVGSLWSLAAFLFIYVAFLGQKQQLLLQNQEMEQQREQFELQRTEQQKQLAEQQAHFQSQQKTITKQNFEASFFQLVNLHHEIISRQHRKFPGTAQELEGRVVFRGLWLMLGRAYQQTPKTTPEPERINLACGKVFKQYGSDVEPWLNSVYQTVKFVDLSEIEDKRFYTSLFRSHFTRFEKILLFYYGKSPWGMQLKPLIERYSLLANVEFELLFNNEHRGLYFATNAHQSD